MKHSSGIPADVPPDAGLAALGAAAGAPWPIWAQVGAPSGEEGGYEWEEVLPAADGTWDTLDDGRNSTDLALLIYPLNIAVGVTAGRIVRVTLARTLGGAVRLVFDPVTRGFWAEITASAADGTNRWKYSWAERVKTSAGYGGWAAPAGGLSGTLDARNTIEAMNSGAGVQGNGVDVANLDADAYTFALQPAPDGVIVWMRPVRVGAALEYWFQYETGVDGTCDE